MGDTMTNKHELDRIRLKSTVLKFEEELAPSTCELVNDRMLLLRGLKYPYLLKYQLLEDADLNELHQTARYMLKKRKG